ALQPLRVLLSVGRRPRALLLLMNARRHRALVAQVAMAFAIAACSSKSADPPPPSNATLIVGLQGAQIASLLSTLTVTTTIGGAPATSDSLDLTKSPPPLP